MKSSRIGQCKLCLDNDVVLEQSHIISRWVFRHSLKDIHRRPGNKRIPAKFLDGKERKYEKQDHQQLLCDSCEDLCLDNVLASFTKGDFIQKGFLDGSLRFTRFFDSSHGILQLAIASEKEDFTRLMKSLVAVIFKACLSDRESYSQISASDNFIASARSFLLGDDSKAEFFNLLRATKRFNFFLQSVDGSPMNSTFIAQWDRNFWTVRIGGMEFSLVFADFEGVSHDMDPALFDVELGKVLILSSEFLNVENLSYSQICTVPSSFNNSYPDKYSCPCGSLKDYLTCCKNIWFNETIPLRIDELEPYIPNFNWSMDTETSSDVFFTRDENVFDIPETVREMLDLFEIHGQVMYQTGDSFVVLNSIKEEKTSFSQIVRKRIANFLRRLNNQK